MRLLQLEDNGEFSLAEYYGKSVPPYAILSHTWGADTEEVSFKDIMEENGRGKNKLGYSKLYFCAEQAASDGLQYFWVDTCCIDKGSSTELTEAINSMFRWYREAARCYVYLADVSVARTLSDSIEQGQVSQTTWTSRFQRSKWFTRGWTLQELLAPTMVEFFSIEGQRLGNKSSLVQDIHKATGIPLEALQESAASLSHFSVDERMSWAVNRETKREEDAAYSLFGLFDLYMPLIYGEGRRNAFIRLYREIRKGSEDEDVDMDLSPGYNHHGVSNPVSTDTSLAETSTKACIDTPRGDLWKATDEPGVFEDANLMRTWWDEASSVFMDTAHEYYKVAVLLLKWADELDELGSRKEVLNQILIGSTSCTIVTRKI
jgi:hypothetical protein